MDKEKTMNAQDKSAATQISIRQIHPFRNHPFKVLDDDLIPSKCSMMTG